MKPLDETHITQLFCERLHQLMDDKNISDSQLSKETGINRVSITNYKNGKRKTLPSSYTLYKLRCYFGVTLEYMLGLTLEKEVKEESKLTGLSYDSIEKLAQHHEYIETFDSFIGTPQFTHFLIELEQLFATFPNDDGNSTYKDIEVPTMWKLKLISDNLRDIILDTRKNEVEERIKIKEERKLKQVLQNGKNRKKKK